MEINSKTQAPAAPVSEADLVRAADVIKQARSLVITSGAGMGVDSGLPSFRDDKGLWNAYPAYEKLGIKFMEIATPRHLSEDPTLGWGFYGQRANQYRDAVPHAGFDILLEWIREFKLQYFAITSNVDGQFQKAGFDEDYIEEVHGSVHYMQCHKPCQPDIWKHQEIFDVDDDSARVKQTPSCIHCGELARPNILMFNDWWYIPTRSNAQNKKYQQFIANCESPVVVIEIGAGRAIPTIRCLSESIGRDHGATVIRINTREPQIKDPHISIPLGGVEALQRIRAALSGSETN